MDKMKNRFFSLKWCLFLYLPIAVVLSAAGVFAIGHGTNYIQQQYRIKYSEIHLGEITEYAVYIDEMGTPRIAAVDSETSFSPQKRKIYSLISSAQVVLIPLWVIFTVGLTGVIFYNRELKEPIETLMNASREISGNRLDFEVYYYKNNELGALCKAFDDMKNALFENNRQLWRSLEERKRLNSAFSHDLRTPLTVLRGYGEFLEKYSADGKISPEKQREILEKMMAQISRLENYTEKMSSVSKLEDIIPRTESIALGELFSEIERTGELISGDKEFTALLIGDKNAHINADSGLVMQVCENILANAARFAENKITVTVSLSETEETLTVTVADDGRGFSEEGLKNAVKPFYRDSENNGGSCHFGLGLYICSVLCAKCGGVLYAENGEKGGKVTAVIAAGG
ncbi:MAG: HAMP domain-containing histidine kinase [Ruminococcus sp.]|nr:HAMP domain-containing histidine kinase [Ruminococcus sp.]